MVRMNSIRGDAKGSRKCELTCFDNIEVFGIDVAVLGKVVVFFRDEYALCGDRVSANPF